MSVKLSIENVSFVSVLFGYMIGAVSFAFYLNEMHFLVGLISLFGVVIFPDLFKNTKVIKSKKNKRWN